MTVYELVEKLGGEIVRGYARVRVGQDYVVVGRLNGDNMDYTEDGRKLAAAQPAQPAETKPKGRKPSDPMVKSDEVGLITEQE
jgi:hypothetical protein